MRLDAITFVDVFGLFAFLLNVWGNLALTKQNAQGWMLRIVSIVCWGIYGVGASSWPNIVNAITFFFINVLGWYRWKKKLEEQSGQTTLEPERGHCEGCACASRAREAGARSHEGVLLPER